MHISEEIRRAEKLSAREAERLEKLYEEIEASSGSMVPEIWQPDASIELDSRMGGQSLDSELFSKDQIAELKELGRRLARHRNRRDKTSMRIFRNIQKKIYSIISDYVEFFRAEDLWELEVKTGGWMAHLTMPGYMDQTEPTRYETLKDAIEGLHEMYADEPAMEEAKAVRHFLFGTDGSEEKVSIDDLEDGDECPNCKNGTVETNEAGELVCLGECGAILRAGNKG